MSKPVLVFDLGGVVVPWIGFEALASMTGLDRETIDRRFQTDPALHDYETGRSTTAEFCDALPRVYGLDIAPADVPALWNSWVLPPFPGVVEAITALRRSHRTACLSNTNALHWAHIEGYFDRNALFDIALASHEMHAAKPHAEIYRMATARLGVQPGDIHFFEDTTVNIEGARAAGWTVHPVDRRHGVLPVLESLELLA